MSDTKRRATLRSALAVAVTIALAGTAQAQGVATTGTVSGQAVADDGSALAEATVTATNVETGFSRQALSAADGFYTIPLLPPGTYTVEIRRIGYQQSRVTNVLVRLGATATVNFRVRAVTVELEPIVVQAAEEVNVTSGGVSQAVPQEQIEELPSLGRDFTDFIRLSGLVGPNPEETTGGKFSIAGQRPSQTSVQIDGVDANSGFFGENRGGSRIPFSFSLESIREFQIITNGFDVEYGNYTGGIVNVVTRGGTNTIEGTAYVNYRSEGLTGDDFDGNPPGDYEVTQYAARVSGPIVRDKAFFLFSLDGQRRREPQVPITVAGVSADDPATGDSLTRFINLLGGPYGINNAAAGYQPFQTSNDVLTLFGRIDWTINPSHRLSVRHNFSSYENGNEFNEFFDFIYGQSRAEVLQDDAHSFVTELQSVFGDRTFNVFRFQYADESRPRLGNDLRPAVIVSLGTGQDAGYAGTFASFQNLLDERKFQIVDNLTHSLGAHTLKVGGSGIFTNYQNQFILQGAGEYRFSSLADFELYRPNSFVRNVRTDGRVPFADFDVAEWGFYAQDEWRITPKLTTTIGVRWDVQRFLQPPARVIEAEQAFGVKTGIAPDDNDNFSPRLSAAYDIGADGRSVVRAGVGYFYGRVPGVIGGNVQSTVLPVLTVTCTGDPLEDDAPPNIAPYGTWSPSGDDNPSTCAGGGGGSGVPTYTFWSEDFQYPETFKANLGYEQLLGDRARFSADLVFSQSTNLYTVRNVNLRDAQFELANEGGRQVFQPRDVFSPVSTSTSHLRNTEFSDVYVNYRDGRARSFSVNVQGSYRLAERTSVGASYTYTTASDNSSYSCCTVGEGYTNPKVGRFGPNEIGKTGDTDRAWGPSDFVRNHTVVVNATTRLPWDFTVSAFWRIQSGNPWGPEQGGDLNGDGVRFNDRPFIFSPENLPLATTDPTEAAEQRARYAGYLADNPCVGDYVGQIVPRNTCRFPVYNRLDLRITKGFRTFNTQRLELQVDVFNVLNGLNSDWGVYKGIFGSRKNLVSPQGFDSETGEILYTVPAGFGTVAQSGTNLLLQFQLQLGLRYTF